MSRSFFVRVCMFTVSNALLMSSATAMVRAGGILWLKSDVESNGYHLPRRHRSSRSVIMKKQNLYPFIVASLNAQSVQGNEMACKRCEISTFIKDNDVDLIL